jgi:signal transduction histidine kinase/AmiR/NasT family two-component response regulator
MPKALLIVDSPEGGAQLRAPLEAEGYVVSTAERAEMGIELARADRPDVVLMDLSLRSAPAWRSIREMKRDPRLSDIPVIVLTTATMGAERERALAAGAAGFVTKPIDERALKRVLAASLETATPDEATLTEPLAIATPVPRSTGRARLLLLSADREFLRLEGTSLRMRRYHVDTAGSAEELAASVDRSPPDLVLLDQSFGNESPHDVAAQIRSRSPGRFLPILYLLEPGSSPPSGAEALADDFISKPVDDVILSTRIRRLLLLGRALRAERQRARELAVVARQMALGIVLFGEDGRITLMNRQAADLLALSARALQGRSARHLFRLAGLEDLSGNPVGGQENSVARLLRSRRAFLREVYQRRQPSGEAIRIEATLAGILTGRRRLQGVSMVLRRASQDSLKQRELQEAYDHLMEVDQLKSKFLSMVSHELRSPLNTIILLSHLLTTEPEDSRSEEKRHHDLEIIRQSGTALLHMINNLLDLAKLEAGQSQVSSETFPLRAFLEETLEIVAPQAENKGLALELRVDAGLGEFATLDREKVRQVLLNLLSNAIKFTAEGNVSLEAGLSAPRSSIVLTVRDSGTGIPPEKLSLIFEPFRQAVAGEDANKGSGLGLSIVRDLVTLMGGEITVDTSPGRGSAFRVTLPRAEARPAAKAEEATHPLPTRPAGTRRILVIEDDEHSRYGLKSVLELEGYEVEEAATAAEARARLAGASPHAVFMDISLPDADGTSLIEEIRRRPGGHDLPIIALTGKTSDEDRRRIKQSGATSYLSKPVDVKAMLKTLARLTVRSLPPRPSPR